MELTLAKLGLFVLSIVVVLAVCNIIRRLVVTRVLVKTSLDRGLQYAIGQLTYYVLLVVGFMTIMQSAGIGISSLTVVLGALTVGIGFGLQNIVNNFVSGLIVLLERPIQVGDLVEVGDKAGVVKHIGARSTHILSPDNIAIIVPNGDLITTKIVNWSIGDPKVCVHLTFNVGFDADLTQVRDLLLAIATQHDSVLKDPGPAVLLNEIGNHAYKMELAVWLDLRHTVPPVLKSDLNLAAVAAFRQNGIHNPVPQQEMILKSPTPAKALENPETNGHVLELN